MADKYQILGSGLAIVGIVGTFATDENSSDSDMAKKYKKPLKIASACIVVGGLGLLVYGLIKAFK